MKQIVFLGLMLMSFTGVAGQVQKADSLISVLNTQELNQADKIKLHLDIVLASVFNDVERTIKYAKKGIVIAEKENDKLNTSKLYNLMSYAYQDKANYDSAQICLEKALDLAIEIGDVKRELNALSAIGTLFKGQEKFHTAIDYYVRALERSDETGYSAIRATILGNMGIIHISLKNYKRAMEYLEQAKELAEKDNDLYVMMGVYHALGKCYLDNRDFEQASNYTQQAYDISIKLNNKIYQSLALGNLALTNEVGFKNYDKALGYALKSLDIAREIGASHEIISAWNILSDIYREKQMYKESEQAALNGWEIDSTSLLEATNFALNITIANVNLGNKKKATEFFWKYNSLKDQSSEKNSYDALMDMEVKYDTEKKEMQIASNEMRITSLEKERRLYVWLGIAGVLLAFVSVIVLLQKIKNARKEKQLIATRSVLDGEMSERSRLARDLHDRLSGNLSAVKMGLNSHKEDLQNLSDKLDNCIDEIRRVAHNLMPTSLQYGMKVAIEDFVSQFPEVHFHFFGQERRIEERLEFVVYCCANELVTNSLRHSGSKNIDVQLIQDEKHVTLTVQDDGCGFDEKSVAKGIGLKNIRDRVASCNGRMDIVTASGKGTETTIELKIENI